MIFYFSATNNSKYVAQRIALETSDEINSIVDCMKQTQDGYFIDEKIIGIVTPTYLWGLPIIVKEFLEKICLSKSIKYIYFIATYGTTPGQTGYFANEIIQRKGKSIDAYFSVKMPDTWTPIFDLNDKNKVDRINLQAEKQIDTVIQHIVNRDCGHFMHYVTPLLLTKLVHQIEYENMRKTKHFKVEDTCVDCSLCARNCPVQAIEMKNNQPVWVKDKCVMCLSCLHHCPKFAIQYGNGRTKKHGQYTHKLLTK